MTNPESSCAPAPAGRIRDWILSVGPFWLASIAGHLALLIVLTLVLGVMHVTRPDTGRTGFDSTWDQPPAPLIDPMIFTKLENELVPELDLVHPGIESLATVDELANDSPPEAIAGGDFIGMNPSSSFTVASIEGFSVHAVSGERHILPGQAGDQPRVTGGLEHRIHPNGTPGGGGIRDGNTKGTEKSVSAALEWLFRHQLPDGSWNMDTTSRCSDETCTHPASIRSSAAATSFALLPLLAAGVTPTSKSTVLVGKRRVDYSRVVAQGLAWLVEHQRSDGNLADGPHVMYTHGLATIALCEAFAMTHDRKLGEAAQAAVRFIEQAQNQEDGGWRYTPGAVPGDTSVVGWQVMAIKSAQLAGLSVRSETLSGVKRYLKRASVAGRAGGLFSYLPDDKAGKISMTAVGMLCNQYMGLNRSDPAMVESQTALMKNLPSRARPDLYYWYYATQAMHNLPGPEWDIWNRALRRLLVETQTKEGCAAGSWDPELLSGKGHVADAGGRLMATSLAALSLEVYYRYLPLYKTESLETAGR